MAFESDGCRCSPCVTGYLRDKKRRRVRRVLNGPTRFVPAGPVRAHALELLQVLTIGQLAQRTGLTRNALMTLVGTYPGRPALGRVTPSTAAAVLACTPDAVGDETTGLVDGTGTRRRLRALVALGWPAQHVGEVLGWTRRNTLRLTADGPLMVKVRTRDDLIELYERLSMTPAPTTANASRARSHAARRGWLPPLAWDDGDIDNPTRGPADPNADDDEDLAA